MEVEGAKAFHNPEPESLKTILSRTTKVCLYCHPQKWSAVHLDVLRIKDFEIIRPLEQVIGKPITNDIPDPGLESVIADITAADRPSGYFQSLFESFFGPHEEEEDLGKRTVDLCSRWIESIRELIRRYPSFDPSLSKRYHEHYSLELTFDRKTAHLKGPYIVFDLGFDDWLFPVLALLDMDHDSYRTYPGLASGGVKEMKRLKRWKKRSKEAEVSSVLIAMAQKQWFAFDKGKCKGDDDPRFKSLQPVMIVATGMKVCFLRARVTLEYLDALRDSSKVLADELVIERSEEIDLAVESDRRTFVIAATALLDRYYSELRPICKQLEQIES